jgi:serine/threonine-protein kinase
MPAARDWSTLNRLLETAVSLPPSERLAWVEQLGSDHASLKPLLRELLTREDLSETGDFLATLPRVALVTGEPQPEGSGGQTVGPYRLLWLLGAGGMGSVWLAERIDGQLTRRVALKLPHLAQGIEGLAERMARERDILAVLEHPNIARLYDAGVASDGRPYLALEYVEGEPIVRYCERRHLDIGGRLRLVAQVARAVAFAHSRLIVHRDLKPSNILVAADGHVRLLDFGIAKILAAGADAAAPPTQLGARAFTLDYASPEQIRGEPISTKTDIYSLGVVLYELLAGSRPFTASDTAGLLPLAVHILSTEARRPSDVVAQASTRRRLRGDLDTIVLKTLQKEPGARYATADELADDLGRYLAGEPVRARPDSRWYRARKLAGRNKVLVAAGVAVVVALASGLSIALWQARIARSEARTASAVERFLVDIFQKNSRDQPDPAHARQTTARELLNIGAQLISGSMTDAPAGKLRVLQTLAGMHQDLELWDEAVALNRQRLQLARLVYGNNDPRVVDALIALSLSMIGSHSAGERKQTLDEAVAILERRGDTRSPLRGRLLGELASYYSDLDLPKALTNAQASVRLLRAAGKSKDLLDSLEIEGWVLNELHRAADAERTYGEAMSVAVSLYGPSSSHLPILYGYLSGAQFYRREFGAAEQSLRKGWEIARTRSGTASGDAMQMEMRLGFLLIRTARVSEGLMYLAEATTAVETTLGMDDPLYTPMIEEVYGVALLRAGNLSESVHYLEHVTESWRHSRPGSTYLMAVLEEQAVARVMLGEHPEAQRLLDEAQVIRTSTGDRTTNLNGDVEGRVELLLASGRTADADAALSRLYVPAGEAADSFVAMDATLLRAKVALARGDARAASSGAKQVYEKVVVSEQRPYLRSFEARGAFLYGSAVHRLGSVAQAEPLLRDAVDLQLQLQDPVRSPFLADAMLELSDCLLDRQKLAEARGLLERARAIERSNARLDGSFGVRLQRIERRLAAAQPRAVRQ